MTEIDVEYEVNAVQRTVGSRALEAGEANIVTLSRVYSTDVEDLWDACTSTERLPRWFAPVSGNLELGGTYQVEGNASGTIETCDPPHSFTATWEFGGQVSWIEVRITAEGDDCARLHLEHIALVGDDIWAHYGPGAVGIGWDLGLLGLSIHLATGAAVPREIAQGFHTTDEGRRFVQAASESWRVANVAFGADANGAKAASDRCAAFYLGEPEPEN